MSGVAGRAAAPRLILILILILAAGIAGAGSAEAQDLPKVISPLHVESDRNGVNLTTGRMAIDIPVLSVPAAPNLRFDRLQNAAPYVLGKSAGSSVDSAIINYSLHTGTGPSESFRCDTGTCVSVTGTGSTFGGNSYTQAGSGARWNFHTRHVNTTRTDPNGTLQYYLTSIVHPNGEVITHSYQSGTLAGDWLNRTWYRPTRISSNMGYHISITYEAGTTVDNGWSSIVSATIYRTGSPSTLLRRFAYSGATIVDEGDPDDPGDDRTYSCGCSNALGYAVESSSGALNLPGESVPTLVVDQTTQTAAIPSTGTTQTNVQLIGTVTRDGVAWDYSYANLTWEGTRGYWYNSVTVTGPNGYRRVYNMAQDENANRLIGMTENVTASTTRSVQYRYAFSGQPDRITYPESNRVDVSYDDYGNIVSRTTTPKPGSGLAAVSESAYVDTVNCSLTAQILCYRPTFSLDGLNRRTDYAYNLSGQLTERTDPADDSGIRRRTIIEYAPSAAGISRREAVRVCGTGADCGTTSEIRTEYDYLGDTFLVTAERRIDLARGFTLETTYQYDGSGNLLVADGPVPGTVDAVYYRYDGFGRRTREVGPLGANGVRLTQEHVYRDSDDKVTRTNTVTVVAPDDTPLVLSRLDYTYDSRRNPIREKVWVGTTTYGILNRRFNDRGQLECEARRMNRTAFATVTSDGCVLGPQGTGTADDGPDRITRNLYDSAGQLLQVQQAYGITTANGFPATLQQNYATYTYSLNGQRTSVTDANGNRAALRYDGFDRLSRWVFPSLTVDGALNEADYEEYGYDAVGNRTSLRKRDDSTLTYQYDALNRMIVKIVPERLTGPQALDPTHTRDVYYAYNVLDLQTWARFDDPVAGPGVFHAYDAVGRLLRATVNLNGTRNIDSLYDAGSRRTRITHPDGRTYTYSYDGASRLTGLYDGAAVAPAELLAGFTYTPRGSVDLRSGGGSSVDHGYDAIGRMTSMAHAFTGGSGNLTYGFSYNPASQMRSRSRSNDSYAWSGGVAVSRPYAVNGLNQYISAGSGSTATTFAYDANGNLTRSGTTNYVYDIENRLVSASGGHTADLRYDPLGRLYEVSGGASGIRRFVYDGDALAVEYTTTGIAARFIHGTSSGDDPIIWYGGNENRRLHADHQGSIVAVTGDDGTLRWINGYDEWGIPNAAGNTGRFQYTGQMWLPELGMYHYKARIYSPTLGRFLQTDPVGYDGGINLYSYVQNDPVNLVDPDGQAPAALGGAVVACAANAWCRRAAVALGALIVSRFVARPSAPPMTAGRRSSASSSDTRTGESTRRSLGVAPAQPSGRQNYTVRVQVQGTGLRQEQSEVISQTTPVTVGQVSSAIAAVTDRLTTREQRMVGVAAERAETFARRVAEAGGLPAVTLKSFGNGQHSESVYRVDIDILRGPRNIVED